MYMYTANEEIMAIHHVTPYLCENDIYAIMRVSFTSHLHNWYETTPFCSINTWKQKIGFWETNNFLDCINNW